MSADGDGDDDSDVEVESALQPAESDLEVEEDSNSSIVEDVGLGFEDSDFMIVEELDGSGSSTDGGNDNNSNPIIVTTSPLDKSEPEPSQRTVSFGTGFRETLGANFCQDLAQPSVSSSAPKPALIDGSRVHNSERIRDNLKSCFAAFRRKVFNEGDEVLCKMPKFLNPKGSSPLLPPRDERDTMICALDECQLSADLACSGCYSAFYCCAEHQETHWANHKIPCSYFALRRSVQLAYRGPIIIARERASTPDSPGSLQVTPGNLGTQRYQMLSLMQIPGLENILDEFPVLLAPWPQISLHHCQDFSTSRDVKIQSATCFGCCSALTTAFHCVKCNLPMCSHSCALNEDHCKNECQIIVKRQTSELGSAFKRDPRTNILKLADQDVEFLYEDVMICRLILLHMREEGKNFSEDENGGWTTKTPKWASLLNTWKYETERRLKESVRGEYVYNHLLLLFPLSLFLISDKMTIWKLFCIIETNAFKFQQPFKRYNVLCSVLPLAHHSCNPNAHAFLDENDSGDVIVRVMSTRRIEKGEPITIAYVPLFYSFMERRLLLLDDHLFWCRCSRCMDITDFKLYSSSFKCSCKKGGYLIPPKELLEMGPGPKPQNITTKIDVLVAQSEYYCRLASPRFDWKCSKQTLDFNPFYLNSSDNETMNHEVITTPQIFNVLSHHDRDSILCVDVPSLCITYLRGLPGKLHHNHTVVMKLVEEVLRGNVLDLSSIGTWTSSELMVVHAMKKKFEAYMKILNPGFAFQGYPVGAFEEIHGEYEKRLKDLVSGVGRVAVVRSGSTQSSLPNAIVRPTAVAASRRIEL